MQKIPAVQLLLITILLSSCTYMANKPLDTLKYQSATPAEHVNLFVFLRGRGGSHQDFAKKGMVEQVRKRNLPFDMVAPNAYFAYYYKRTLLTRLREDVILPAKQQGYENIWLIGISMGGLGSLLYLTEFPDDIGGVYLISPFLGYDDIIREIDTTGGVLEWQPGEYVAEDDWQRMLWHWIKKDVSRGFETPIYLGAGEADTYRDAQKIISDVLPKQNVIMIEGKHDYDTFSALWIKFLDSGVFQH